MKILISIVFAVVAFAVVYSRPGSLAQKEVKELLRKNPNMTEDECVLMCDDFFQLVDERRENQTDRMCQRTCQCFVNGKDGCKQKKGDHGKHGGKDKKDHNKGDNKGRKNDQNKGDKKGRKNDQNKGDNKGRKNDDKQ